MEKNYYMSKMEPAIRDYLTQMRDDASIEIKTGYIDTGASPNKQIFPIAYSAYTPPSPKKKRKVERTRFRETEHGFRQKTKPAQLAASDQAPPPTPAASKKKKGSSTNRLQRSRARRKRFVLASRRPRRCPRHLRARRKMQAQKHRLQAPRTNRRIRSRPRHRRYGRRVSVTGQSSPRRPRPLFSSRRMQ